LNLLCQLLPYDPILTLTLPFQGEGIIRLLTGYVKAGGREWDVRVEYLESISI